MCINKRWVINPYTRKRILVKCGKCPACLASNARHRAGRLKNNVYKGEVCLFCTLTYANEFVPYVRVQDLRMKQKNLPVYRDAYVRRARVSGDYEMRYKVYNERKILDTFYVGDELYQHQMDYPHLNNKPNCVGVCYYKDIQDFFKRLDINLKRRYGFKGHYSRFACHEYGTKGKRPHFHLAVFCKSVDMQTLKTAICEAWPYDRGDVRHRKCEQQRKSVANYIASYVNSIASFHPLLSSHSFRSKCSYSRGFGLAPSAFDVDLLLDNAQKGSLQWSFQTLKNGVQCTVDAQVPEYVINRIFPKFKGYSRLACDQIHDILQNPDRLSNYVRILEYTNADLHREKVKLKNARLRYKYPLRFADDYILVWSVRTRETLRGFYQTLTNSQYDYDNIEILKYKPWLNRSLLPLVNFESDLNPNNFPQNVSEHKSLLEEFHNRQKHKEINQEFFIAKKLEQLI